MSSAFQDNIEAIKAHVVKVEAEGTEEALLAAAKCLSSYRLDRKFYGELFGLDQCPRLAAVVETLPADFTRQHFGVLWPSNSLCAFRVKGDEHLAELLSYFQSSVRQHTCEMTRRRDSYDLLEETLATLEREGSDADIRLAMSCFVLLPWSHPLRHMNLLEGKSRVRAALKNGHGGDQHVCTEACRTRVSAGVKAAVNGQLHQWRDQENILGRVAALIIHYQDERRSSDY